MTKEQVDLMLRKMNWVKCKSYVNDPHHYSRIMDINTDEVAKAWKGVVTHIWENRKMEYWKYGKSFPYYRANGYKYWVMDKTINSTDLINRAKI
ncbi:MAG: hypothetical protein Unbinned3205contig1001_33 [Prokaryotic dsDNA virus sp.]|nr:MAG: hypothetical protein Unbinned3205contig1001_33 [Prokaryotic dsDNA virus sp.]|tara:strand:- start:16911 stop:17192 length:282 start_codon:yes stop_codon:yes gene_type:complete